MAYYSMSQVIKMRRKAMGHSRYEYDVEGPSAMAVYRLEEKSIWVSERAYRKLTKAMGEEESTRRGLIRTKDIRALWMFDKVLYGLFEMDYEKTERLLEELETVMDCTVKRNRDYLDYLKAKLQHRQKKSADIEYRKAIEKSISYGTYELEELLKKAWPFKEREHSRLQDFVEIIRKGKEHETQMELLFYMKGILETEYMGKEYRAGHLAYVCWRLGDVLGNLGKHREAIQFDEKSLLMCKDLMEERYLAQIYYDIFWNYWMMKKKETLTKQEEIRCKECLLKAYYINLALFPENKLYRNRILECYPEELS